MPQPTADPGVPSTPPVAPPLPAGPPVVPDVVRQFAEENGIANHLPALLELMARVLPGQPITVRLDWDPSIPDDGYITFWADASGLSGDQWLAAYEAWRDGVSALCPRDHTHFFHFGA